MSETKNAPPRVYRWYRVGGAVMQYLDWMSDGETRAHVFSGDDGADVKIAVSEWPSADAVSLGTTGQRFAALEARIAALEARLLAPPAVAGTPSPESVAVFPGGFVPAHDVSDEVRASLRACNVDHDTCSAEQRSGTGRAAQGTCVRGVVDLVAASADDQHAAERGTPAAGAEVTASEGGDTARDDSVVAEAVDMLVKADAHERVAAALDPYDSARRAELMYAAKGLRRAAEERIEVVGERLLLAEAGVLNLSKRLAEARAERDAANAKVESMRSGVREMEAERDAMRHELAEMRAELERERVRRKAADDALSKSVSGEHRKWATAIASALDRVDYSGCESFVGREEMAARVAAMRAELERERKLRRESEEAFKAASDPRSGVAQKRGLVTGARVRSLDGAGRAIARGKIVGWDEDGDPEVEHVVAGRACTDTYFADFVELDTEATT